MNKKGVYNKDSYCLIIGGQDNKIEQPKEREINNILDRLLKSREEEIELIKKLKQLTGE